MIYLRQPTREARRPNSHQHTFSHSPQHGWSWGSEAACGASTGYFCSGIFFPRAYILFSFSRLSYLSPNASPHISILTIPKWCLVLGILFLLIAYLLFANRIADRCFVWSVLVIISSLHVFLTAFHIHFSTIFALCTYSVVIGGDRGKGMLGKTVREWRAKTKRIEWEK